MQCSLADVDSIFDLKGYHRNKDKSGIHSMAGPAACSYYYPNPNPGCPMGGKPPEWMGCMGMGGAQACLP